MEMLMEKGEEGLAKVFVARFRQDDRYLAEFVDSLSGSSSPAEKWVAILSSQFGCPVGCRFCDAGGRFFGNLTRDELLAQLDFLVRRRFGGRGVPSRKFKVQFARMGEPALNLEVVDALVQMKQRYDAPGLLPCISTMAPSSSGDFFERLLQIKRDHFPESFQLQFSVHTTDERTREWLVPHPKWDLDQMAEYGARFHGGRGRKVALNFALSRESVVEPAVLRDRFDPAHFMVKLTPVNPTENARLSDLVNPLGPDYSEGSHPLVRELREAGFDVVVSIGALEENQIGSNCGQVAALWRRDRARSLPAN